MKKLYLSLLIFYCFLNINYSKAQSVFSNNYDNIYFKKVFYLNNGNTLLTDGKSYIELDQDATKINSGFLSLTSNYLLQDQKVANDGSIYSLYQYSNGSGSNAMFSIICLNPNLSIKWNKIFSSSTGSSLAYSLSINNNDEIIVCGSTCSTGFFLLKLDNDGNQKWKKEIESAGFNCTPSSIYCENDVIYCAAKIYSNSENYFALFKINSNSQIIATNKLLFPSTIYIKSIKMKGSYLYSLINSDSKSYIVKSSTDFQNISRLTINADNDIQLNDFCLINDNIFLCGNINSGLNSNLDVIEISFNTIFNFLWAKVLNSDNLPAIGYDNALSICSDNNNRIYTVGSIGLEGFITKFNISGEGFCNSSAIEILHSTELIVSSSFNSSISNSDIFLETFQNLNSNQNLSYVESNCSFDFINDVSSSEQNIDEVKSDIIIYPNPCSNSFTIKSNSIIKSVIVYDLIGRIVKRFDYSSEFNSCNIAELSAGNYIINCLSDYNISTNYKLVKI